MNVTGTEKEPDSGVNSGNAVVELLKSRDDRERFRQLIKPAVEETHRALGRAEAAVKRKLKAGELKVDDPRAGFWETLFEYQEQLPPEVKEARRLVEEARKTAKVCGICAKDMRSDEVVYQSKACTGIAVMFRRGPIYRDTVLCEGCAPSYMVREAKGDPLELPGGRLSYMSRFAERTCATCARPVVIEKSGHDRRRPIVIEPDTQRWTAAYFCCDRCRWAFYNGLRNERAARAREKTCGVCGEEFIAARRDAKTCRPACKQKAYRQRQKGRANGKQGRGGA